MRVLGPCGVPEAFLGSRSPQLSLKLSNKTFFFSLMVPSSSTKLNRSNHVCRLSRVDYSPLLSFKVYFSRHPIAALPPGVWDPPSLLPIQEGSLEHQWLRTTDLVAQKFPLYSNSFLHGMWEPTALFVFNGRTSWAIAQMVLWLPDNIFCFVEHPLVSVVYDTCDQALGLEWLELVLSTRQDWRNLQNLDYWLWNALFAPQACCDPITELHDCNYPETLLMFKLTLSWNTLCWFWSCWKFALHFLGFSAVWACIRAPI